MQVQSGIKAYFTGSACGQPAPAHQSMPARKQPGESKRNLPHKRRPRVSAARFCDLEAEQSDDVEDREDSGGSGEDVETAEDRAMIDDSEAGGRDRVKRRRVRLTEEDKELCADDYLLLRDFCVGSGLAKGEPSKAPRERRPRRADKWRAVADADDAEEVHSSDLDFISDTELQVEAEVGHRIKEYVAKQGVVLSAPKSEKSKSDLHQEAKRDAYKNTMAFLAQCKGKPSERQPQRRHGAEKARPTAEPSLIPAAPQRQPTRADPKQGQRAKQAKQACGESPKTKQPCGESPKTKQSDRQKQQAAARVRPTESSRAVAPVFSPGAWRNKEKREAKGGDKGKAPEFAGLTVNPISKAVFYADGRGNRTPFLGDF